MQFKKMQSMNYICRWSVICGKLKIQIQSMDKMKIINSNFISLRYGFGLQIRRNSFPRPKTNELFVALRPGRNAKVSLDVPNEYLVRFNYCGLLPTICDFFRKFRTLKRLRLGALSAVPNKTLYILNLRNIAIDWCML